MSRGSTSGRELYYSGNKNNQTKKNISVQDDIRRLASQRIKPNVFSRRFYIDKGAARACEHHLSAREASGVAWGEKSEDRERERQRENEGGFINLLGASVGHTSHGNVER